MKIIQVSTYFHPYIGGVERVVYELSKQLTVLGHDVTVLTTDRKNSIKDFSGFTVIKSKQLIEVCGEPVSISLFNYLKKSKVDLVHIHFSKLLIPTISVIICRLIGLPTIITLHVVDDYKSSLKRLLSFLYRISIGRLVFKFANKIVVPSEINLEEKLIQRYKNKVLVIPHGVNLNFKSRKKKRHGKFRVLFVGKLSRRLYFKGLNFLIRAMSRLSKNIELVVIGEGETKKEYQKLTKILGLEDRVKFLGYVKEDELWKCYSSADCLVLPSTSIRKFWIGSFRSDEHETTSYSYQCLWYLTYSRKIKLRNSNKTGKLRINSKCY